MKTLSVRQPWADLIMRGIKDIENRSWTTSYRGPLLIHASKTFVPGPAVAAFYGPDHQWEQGGIIGTVDLVDVVTDSDSQWAQRDGQTFHWVLANPQRAPFVPMNGKLNLYETPSPSATPSAPAHRRDERVPAEDDIEIDGDDVAAVEVVARALSRARFFEIANELLNDMPSDHEEAILDFVASLECNFHDVLAVMTLEDMNLVLKHVGQQPHADVESAAAALALAIATEDDFAALDEDEDEDENEDDADDADDADDVVVEGASAASKPPRQPARDGIESVDVETVMAAFRQAARGQGRMERIDLLRAVCRELGYARLGSTIEGVLRGHLRAAVRRRVIEVDGQQVQAATNSIDDYAMEELRDALVMGLGRGQQIDRDEAIRQTIRSLGFIRVTDAVRAAFKSVFNSAIRQGLLESGGSDVVARR